MPCHYSHSTKCRTSWWMSWTTVTTFQVYSSSTTTSPRHGWTTTPDSSYYSGTSGPTWDLGPQQSWMVPQRVEEPDPKGPSQPVWVRHTRKESWGYRPCKNSSSQSRRSPAKEKTDLEGSGERLVRLKDRLTTCRKTPMQYWDAVGHLVKLNWNSVNIELCELLWTLNII